nr:immunoglobulin heavy chain junction region [Macaca mulatta]
CAREVGFSNYDYW